MSETTLELSDGEARFAVTVVEAWRPRCFGLFAVGAGGNPLRHLPLMEAVADRGCTMIAPHYAMMTTLTPSREDMEKRIRWLELSADACASKGQPIVGIGHSIGTVALLAMAGGEPWTVTGRFTFQSKWQFARLALFTPAADFFMHPGALQGVAAPLQVWAGGQDRLTPPTQAEFLRRALTPRVSVDLHVDEGAGHFTYMDELPPNIVDPHPDRIGFLSSLADDVARFVTT